MVTTANGQRVPCSSPCDGEQLYLLPASWTHVIEAFNAMQRYGSKIRPCPLTAASVFLNAASKMSVSALHAVISFQTINFMKNLWACDQTLKPDSSARCGNLARPGTRTQDVNHFGPSMDQNESMPAMA